MAYQWHCYGQLGSSALEKWDSVWLDYVLNQRPLYGFLPLIGRIHLNQGVAVSVFFHNFTYQSALRIFLPLPKNFAAAGIEILVPMGRMRLQDTLWFHYIEWRGYQLAIWGSLYLQNKNGAIWRLEWLVLVTTGKLACLFYTVRARSRLWNPEDFLGNLLVLSCLILRLMKN